MSGSALFYGITPGMPAAIHGSRGRTCNVDFGTSGAGGGSTGRVPLEAGAIAELFGHA